jgi:hypothetical protein
VVVVSNGGEPVSNVRGAMDGERVGGGDLKAAIVWAALMSTSGRRGWGWWPVGVAIMARVCFLTKSAVVRWLLMAGADRNTASTSTDLAGRVVRV